MTDWYKDLTANQEYESEMHQLYSEYKFQSRIWQERAERMKALAASRKELLRESEEAIKELLPVVQYILEKGWDEAPPLFGTKFDETKANILGINILAKLAEELADD